MEEALKYEGLSAVVCEVKELSFLASRRLQLAVEKSQVTGFVLQYNPRVINTTACICRWKITTLPTSMAGDMPGVGFPRWQVNLLKVRNGRPGNWQLEWVAGRFRHINTIPAIVVMPKKKTG
jgi:protein ImuA